MAFECRFGLGNFMWPYVADEDDVVQAAKLLLQHVEHRNPRLRLVGEELGLAVSLYDVAVYLRPPRSIGCAVARDPLHT